MELQRIKQLTPQEMYRIDLQAFVAALELREAEEAADEEEFQKQRKQAGKGKKGKAARKVSQYNPGPCGSFHLPMKE